MERTATRRRQLGALMRKLRTRSRLTLEEAGQLVGISKATVSRYETQSSPVKWLVVDALCREYGATEAERQAVAALTRDAARQGWWNSPASSADTAPTPVPVPVPVPEAMDLLLTLEDEAVREDQYCCVYVPELLQTRAYGAAVQRTSELPCRQAEMEHHLDLRMRRQQILRRDAPPRLSAVLDESVLRRVVGSPAVMREQLDRLLAANKTAHITLQVLPFTAGAHTAALGSFTVLGGAEPSLDVVHVDLHTDSLFLEREEDLARYRLAFDHLRDRALDAGASSSLMRRVRKEL